MQHYCYNTGAHEGDDGNVENKSWLMAQILVDINVRQGLYESIQNDNDDISYTHILNYMDVSFVVIDAM